MNARLVWTVAAALAVVAPAAFAEDAPPAPPRAPAASAKAAEGEMEPTMAAVDAHFRAAKACFGEKDSQCVAREMRAGAAILKQAAPASGEARRKALIASAQEIDRLSLEVEALFVEKESVLDDAFNRAVAALAMK